MENIEDYTEKLDLMQRTKNIELRQKQRIASMQALAEKEKEKEREKNLIDGFKTTTPSSVLDQEDEQRKKLVHDMNINPSENLRPAVKVLNNVASTMGKMRRNHENTHEIVKVNHYEIKAIKNEVSEFRSDVKDACSQIKRATFNTLMDG